MANTYSQLYFHILFAVKGRTNIISKNWQDELYKYISGIVTNKGQKMMMPNHIHLLLGTMPNCNLSDLVRDIKANSPKWVNEKRLVKGKFEWQVGFGAFSIGQSQIPKIVDYIKRQEEHHRTKTFREEYIGFLKIYGIGFKEEYIFTED
jgi:putative transposase